jgi:hypothetical protein
MQVTIVISALMSVLTLTACAASQGLLDRRQGIAMQTAVTRGQSELNCQEVTPTLISRELIKPVLQGGSAKSTERAEYTVGISGCDKRGIFVVICIEDIDVCFAAGPGPFHDWR